MTPDNETKPITALERSIEIIEELQAEGACGVTELSQRLDIPKSTVHNHLATLERHDYLIKRDGVYDLSLRFLGLGEVTRERRDLYQVAAPEVDALSDETGEIASIMTEEQGLGVFLYRSEGEQTVEVDSHSGYRTHLHTTALGKAILAYLPDERIDEIIEQHGLSERTKNTITKRSELMENLSKIRDRRVAFDDEERIRGFRAVAAPITNEQEESIGSISLAGPTRRLQDDRLESEYPDRVRQAANVIELNITHR